MKRLLFTTSCLIVITFLIFQKPIYAMESGLSTIISAHIPETTVTINGFTSPLSKVEMTGINTYSLTYSDSDGYFEFPQNVLPKQLNELCFQSSDDNGLTTALVCIPPPPSNQYHTDIGPIILPPTIGLSQQSVSGNAIPNSPINIFLFTDNKSLIKPAEAYSLPIYQTMSDEHGKYSFSLPLQGRFFATTQYQSENSPKSVTLQYLLPSYNYLYLLSLILIMTLLFLFYLINKNKKNIRYLPALYPKSLILASPKATQAMFIILMSAIM